MVGAQSVAKAVCGIGEFLARAWFAQLFGHPAVGAATAVAVDAVLAEIGAADSPGAGAELGTVTRKGPIVTNSGRVDLGEFAHALEDPAPYHPGPPRLPALRTENAGAAACPSADGFQSAPGQQSSTICRRVE